MNHEQMVQNVSTRGGGAIVRRILRPVLMDMKPHSVGALFTLFKKRCPQTLLLRIIGNRRRYHGCTLPGTADIETRCHFAAKYTICGFWMTTWFKGQKLHGRAPGIGKLERDGVGGNYNVWLIEPEDEK